MKTIRSVTPLLLAIMLALTGGILTYRMIGGLYYRPRSFLHTTTPITHVVIFQYKKNTSIAQKQTVSKAFLALRQNCLAPYDQPGFDSPGKPYIQSTIAGSNDSLEPPAKGYEHTYVVNFASPDHRDYYVGLDPNFADPAHSAFKELVGPLVEKVVVTDFTDGLWDDKGPEE